MEWQFVLALIVIAPIILLPVMFVWYLNVAGVYAMVRDRVQKLTAKQNATMVVK